MNNLYKIIEDVNLPYIELLDESAEFSGICFRYGEVKFNESEQVLTFDWEMLDSNGLPKESFTDDFKTLIGDILVNILETHVKEGTLVYDDRGDNTSSIDAQ